jgi:hypothetical protein
MCNYIYVYCILYISALLKSETCKWHRWIKCIRFSLAKDCFFLDVRLPLRSSSSIKFLFPFIQRTRIHFSLTHERSICFNFISLFSFWHVPEELPNHNERYKLCAWLTGMFIEFDTWKSLAIILYFLIRGMELIINLQSLKFGIMALLRIRISSSLSYHL